MTRLIKGAMWKIVRKKAIKENQELSKLEFYKKHVVWLRATSQSDEQSCVPVLYSTVQASVTMHVGKYKDAVNN
uniref:Uncharacterized protein n=1 Tax=Heterorhabditis bacteriophora TaxID=37862 RepID=A0A1I7XF13_HETBA